MALATRVDQADFHRDGYAVISNVLNLNSDIRPVLDEYAMVLQNRVEHMYSIGALRTTYSNLEFIERLIAVQRDTKQDFAQDFDFSLPQQEIRRDTPIHLGPAVFNILTNPRLLDVVEEVVGPEIYASPVQHIRIKPPAEVLGTDADGRAKQTPWHQDNAVILPEADESDTLTVWVPMTSATEANGCLQVVPGSHMDGMVTHCPKPGVGAHIPDPLVPLDRAIPLPMTAGSILLLHQRTIHGSLENQTADQVRISMDLRYLPIGKPTGRPQFPGFIARSHRDPESALRDSSRWAQMWLDTRARLAVDAIPAFNRWDSDSPACA